MTSLLPAPRTEIVSPHSLSWTFQEGRLSLDGLLDPFRFLNLSQFYDQFSAVIDLLVYSLVFIGAAQVTLGRRYPGRGGRAMVIGVGLALAVGMVLAEERFGFSIRAFGPLAAGTLVLLFAIMVYCLLRWVSLGKLSSLGLTLLLLALGLLALAPSLPGWIETKGLPAGGLWVVLLALSLLALLSPVPSGGGSRHIVEERIHRIERNDRVSDQRRNSLLGEGRFLKRHVKPEARKVKKESKVILRDLKSVREVVRRQGNDPQMRQTIIVKMRELTPKGIELHNDIERLKALNGRIQRLDAGLFSEESQTTLKQMDGRSRSLLKLQLRDETKRLDIEGKIERLEEAARQEIEMVFRHLRSAADFLQEGRIRESLESLEKAIESERALSGLARILKALENYLLSLTRAELRVNQ